MEFDKATNEALEKVDLNPEEHLPKIVLNQKEGARVSELIGKYSKTLALQPFPIVPVLSPKMILYLLDLAACEDAKDIDENVLEGIPTKDSGLNDIELWYLWKLQLIKKIKMTHYERKLSGSGNYMERKATLPGHQLTKNGREVAHTLLNSAPQRIFHA